MHEPVLILLLQLFSFASHSLAVRCLSISATGFIATGSDDKEVRIWDCR